MLSRLLDGFRVTNLTWLDAIDILIVAFIISMALSRSPTSLIIEFFRGGELN